MSDFNFERWAAEHTPAAVARRPARTNGHGPAPVRMARLSIADLKGLDGPAAIEAWVKREEDAACSVYLWNILYGSLRVLTKAVTELETRNAALEAKCAALEARPSLEDKGVWSDTEHYKAQAVVTFDGSMWIAQRPTTPKEKPGESSSWRLCVHRGKPGKDGRPGQDLR